MSFFGHFIVTRAFYLIDFFFSLRCHLDSFIEIIDHQNKTNDEQKTAQSSHPIKWHDTHDGLDKIWIHKLPVFTNRSPHQTLSDTGCNHGCIIEEHPY
ncbi:hypothetical protein D3C72_1318600 [compost metagenome]